MKPVYNFVFLSHHIWCISDSNLCSSDLLLEERETRAQYQFHIIFFPKHIFENPENKLKKSLF